MSAPTNTTTATIPKPRPYRRYLTSALHSRFVHAVGLAYVTGIAVSEWTAEAWIPTIYTLAVFPIAGALFCMSSLFVFMLQLATLTVGRKTSPSPVITISSAIFDPSTYYILTGYLVSGWWFGEVYVWTVPASQNLGWVIRGGMDEADQLNERPIYLRFFFLVMAVLRTVIHVYDNHSALHVAVTRPPAAVKTTPGNSDIGVHPASTASSQVRRRLPYVFKHGLTSGAIATIITPFIYRWFFRDLFWQMHLAIAKLFFDLSSKDANPPNVYFIGTILGKAFGLGVTLSVVWELACDSFLHYIQQEPLKNGLPLSAASKDPNGTLLTGLTAKRDVVKTFAFWELALITQRFPDRRKAIFADFERADGPMWTAMHKAAMVVIGGVEQRILALTPVPPSGTRANEPVTTSGEIITLPNLIKDPIQQAKYAAMPPRTTRSQKVIDFLVNTEAKNLGTSSDPWRPPIDATTKQMLEEAKKLTGHTHVRETVTHWYDVLRGGSAGAMLEARPACQVSSTVLGSPVGNAAIIVDAIESVTKMSIASLNEDNFGKAVHTVPETVKQFTRTVMLMETFIKSHVTTVRLTAKDERELAEVLIVLERIKSSLRELLSAFQVFLTDAGLSVHDFNAAKKAGEERAVLPALRNPADAARAVPERQNRTQTMTSGQETQTKPRKQLTASERERQAEQRRHSEREASLRRIQAAGRDRSSPPNLESHENSLGGTGRGLISDTNVLGAREPVRTRTREMEQVK